VAEIWQSIKYGWSHLHWLTIEGVPYVFSQAVTGKTVPAGYTSEIPTLVVAESARIGAVINRDTGIGAGFPLTFTALDSSELASLMARPTAQTTLTQTMTAAGATADVVNAGDFAASGVAYIGKERMTYGSKTATALNLSGRGVNGLAYPHSARSTGAVVTDTPRYWRGRFVTLYASPVDPTGYVTGTALEDDALVIWRGFLDREPMRSGDGAGFEFSALPIDRILARPLASRLSGKVQDTDVRFEIEDTQCMFKIELLDASGANIAGPWPIKFDAMASASFGDLVSVTEFNASAIAAFAAAVVVHGAGAHINGLDIIQSQTSKNSIDYGAYGKGDWVPVVRFVANSSVRLVRFTSFWCGALAQSPGALAVNGMFSPGPAGMLANNPMMVNVSYAWSPYSITNAYLGYGGGSKPTKPSLAIKLDQGDPGTLPTTGQVEIGGNVYTYAGVGQSAAAATVIIKNVAAVNATSSLDNIMGAPVAILISDTGTLADVTLRMIHSSGELDLRDTTYDKLLGRVGYGLPDAYTDDDEIAKVLSEGLLAGLDLVVSPDDKSYSDTVGGLLALSRRAVVVTDDGTSDARLSAVYTGSGVGGYAAQLTDAHVLSVPAAKIEIKPNDNPNSISITAELADVEVDASVTTDVSRVAFEGLRQLEFSIPSKGSEAFIVASALWSFARVAGDQHAAVMSIDVVPWLGVRIGDAVDLTLTHPKLWSWLTSTVGYTGGARCIGRQLQLSTGAMRLDLLIYGQAVGTALCPSAPVSAFAGTAGAPTTIDIPAGFAIELNRALTANAANLRLLKYDPGAGAEGITEGYTVSAASVTAGVCRLTVVSVIGSPTLSASTSFLTWAEAASAGSYEKTFAHSGDSTRWT
jgi:hypothetical protein